MKPWRVPLPVSRALCRALVFAWLASACGQGISIDFSSQGAREPDATWAPDVDARASDADGADADARGKDAPIEVDAASRVDASLDAPKDVAGPDASIGADAVDGVSDDADSTTPGDDAENDGAGLDGAGLDGAGVDGASDDVLPDVSADQYGDVGDGADVGRDTSGDASRDAVPDGPREAGDACPPTGCPEPVADFYVDATAAAGGDGSKLRPFKTITEAARAYAAAPGQAKKAYVRPGKYDRALGEVFPLVLRGLSIEGAGPELTIVEGAGHLLHADAGGRMTGDYMVTILASDALLPTNISNLTLRTSSPAPVTNYFGVFCDRGSATGGVPSPGGVTHLDRVKVGPGFDRCVLATNSERPAVSGCNLLVTRSHLTRAWMGVSAEGCWPSDPVIPIVIEIGTDDPASGNTFSWMQHMYDWAAGVAVNSCVPRGSLQYNTFVDSAIGISLADLDEVGLPTPYHFVIKHNTFERLTRLGIETQGSRVFVDELSDNRFLNISLPPAQGEPGRGGIAVDTTILDMGKVRRNEFIGNDTGIVIHSGPVSASVFVDLGTDGDPGGNVFRCNSGGISTGGDLLFVGDPSDPDANWAGTIPLRGNAWDHAPPTMRRDVPMTNGVDIHIVDSPHAVLDVGNSIVATPACPAGHIPGQ